MEKLKKYQLILSELVESFAKAAFSVQPGLENQAITDMIHNHFQVVTLGWENGKFVFDILLHFDIKDDKIWIQQNWTDVLIDEELIKKGVEKADIVVGFLPPYAREYAQLATV
ncbi:XisI protein [Runella sp.]|uniref:XisI protein n=1 Tax=Runella sp. TaxID=1960881 RepID=UPI003D0DD9A4